MGLLLTRSRWKCLVRYCSRGVDGAGAGAELTVKVGCGVESATVGAAYMRVFHCGGRACTSCRNSRAVFWRVWLLSGSDEVSSSWIARGGRKPGMAR